MIFSQGDARIFETLKNPNFEPFLTHLAHFRKNKIFRKESGFVTLEPLSFSNFMHNILKS